MVITEDTIRAITPRAKASIAKAVAEVVSERGPEFGVDNPKEVCHFLAQCAYESDGFKTTVEYASGQAYEGRKDLGNTKRGDGRRFKGRGIIQLTGRANYRQAGKDLGLPLETSPHLAANPETSVLIALWYWKTRGLSKYANRDDIRTITKRINGGLNGFSGRKMYFRRAWATLGRPKRVSTTKIAAAGMGGAGTFLAYSEYASVAANTAMSARETYDNLGPYVLAAAIALGVIVFGAWWIIHERNKKAELYLA